MGGRARVQAHSVEAASGGRVRGALPVLCTTAAGWYTKCIVLSLGDKLGCVPLLHLMSLLQPVLWPEAGSMQLRMTPHLARQVDLFRGLQEGLLPREAPLLLILHGIVGARRIHQPGPHSAHAFARGSACAVCSRKWASASAVAGGSPADTLCALRRQLRRRLREKHVRGSFRGGLPPCSP